MKIDNTHTHTMHIITREYLFWNYICYVRVQSAFCLVGHKPVMPLLWKILFSIWVGAGGWWCFQSLSNLFSTHDYFECSAMRFTGSQIIELMLYNLHKLFDCTAARVSIHSVSYLGRTRYVCVFFLKACESAENLLYNRVLPLYCTTALHNNFQFS